MPGSCGFQDMTLTDQTRVHSNTGMYQHSMKKIQIFRINLFTSQVYAKKMCIKRGCCICPNFEVCICPKSVFSEERGV